MSKVRKIKRTPPLKNYFIVDACFLVNKHIPLKIVPENQKDRIQKCLDLWEEIDKQLKRGCARVYIPDVCVAETFKVLAKKYFEENWFSSSQQLNYYRTRCREEICTSANELRRYNRSIKYHDISTTRDIIISVDRFYQLFGKHKIRVSLPDIIILATAKYLMDYFDIPRDYLHIITLDNALYRGSKKAQDLPNAYNPTLISDSRDRIFI